MELRMVWKMMNKGSIAPWIEGLIRAEEEIDDDVPEDPDQDH